MKRKVFSSDEVQMELFQPFEFVAPKIYLEYPELSASDIIKCEIYVNDLNVIHDAKLIIDIPNKEAVVIKDGVMGFIQRRSNKLIAIFKDGTIDNISKAVSLKKFFDHYNVFPVTDDNVEFNINGVVNLIKSGRSS